MELPEFICFRSLFDFLPVCWLRHLTYLTLPQFTVGTSEHTTFVHCCTNIKMLYLQNTWIYFSVMSYNQEIHIPIGKSPLTRWCFVFKWYNFKIFVFAWICEHWFKIKYSNSDFADNIKPWKIVLKIIANVKIGDLRRALTRSCYYYCEYRVY